MAVPQFVLLGPPASGKGTQGRRLAEHAGLAYFSTGKQLRREVKAGTELGIQAEPFLEAGHYVPDELVLSLALDWIAQQDGGWILDGFPRTLPQGTALDVGLESESEGLRALLLEVSAEELERRVTERRECTACSWTGTRVQAESSGNCPACGGVLGVRHDDDLENFQMRLKAFEELTLPVARHYESSGRLLRVGGSGTPEEVFQRVQSLTKLP